MTRRCVTPGCRRDADVAWVLMTASWTTSGAPLPLCIERAQACLRAMAAALAPEALAELDRLQKR